MNVRNITRPFPLMLGALAASTLPLFAQDLSTAADGASAKIDHPRPVDGRTRTPISGVGAGASSSQGSARDILSCVRSLRDANGGSCLEASATPTLGMLFALSQDLCVEDATGHVGVGTTNPGRKLGVVKSIANDGVATFDNPDSAGFSGVYFEENGQGRGWAGHVNEDSAFGAPGTMQFGSQFDDMVFSVDDTQFFVERMRIDTDGNVGIGTNSPAGKLHVNAPIRSGSETGTSQGPDTQGGSGPAYAGLVSRRLVTSSSAVGQIVARGPVMRLERDGTNGGLQMVWGATTDAILSAHGFAITQGGAMLPIRDWGFNQFAGGSFQVTDDADTVVSLHLSFGNFHNRGHTTDVVLNRSSLSGSWVGTVNSTFNQ